ncbi:MAG: histidine phosphatase family protein [Acidobacteria bacterium]|nr:histidine phosphatase family protein [Acidobacteriota bacterium]
MHLFLIRHGETLPNRRRKFQGSGDFPLTDRGLAQAKQIASFFNEIQLNRIYASPMIRAMETAAPLAKQSGLAPVSIPQFHEVDCGRWEGVSFFDILKNEESLLRNWLTDGKTPAPNGESLGDVYRRIARPLQEIVDRHRHSSDNVAIVAHGAVNRAVICRLLELKPDRAFCFEQENACINRFVLDEPFPPKLTMLNSTSHLGG